MVRALSKNYTGPMYQVRSGSSAMNTGSGGMLKDIPMLPDGFADTAVQDAFCSGTTCTVSLLYDHSGNGNHLPVAKKGLSAGGATAAMDDYESAANKGMMTIKGHKVYSLYMNAREGYRIMRVGTKMPVGSASQGIYMLADGTHSGTACCWDFGNVTTNPQTYADMNTLFFGVAFWGKGAGSGPWMMADFEAGVWSGGSKIGDPGWGGLNDAQNRVNPANPSLKVPFAFGTLRTQANPSQWTLRGADLQTATNITTAYQGAMPKEISNIGAVVLGVGGDNSNNSWGTFYEGAIVAGYPTNDDRPRRLQQHQGGGVHEIGQPHDRIKPCPFSSSAALATSVASPPGAWPTPGSRPVRSTTELLRLRARLRSESANWWRGCA